MAEDKDPLVNIEISSPISLKAEIKAKIPKKSVGRLVDALTDAIRPFTEARGLKADHIRLQREEILIEIARRAGERLTIEGKSPVPLPNKFLVPFLEKASNEDGDTDLIDKWANLLVSASTAFNSSHIRFTSILSEMGGREVKMLERFCSSARSSRSVTFVVDVPIDGRANFFSDSLVTALDRLVAGFPQSIKEQDFNEVINRAVGEDEGPGFIVDNVFIQFDEGLNPIDGDGEKIAAIEFPHPLFPPNVEDDEIATSVLENLGLIKNELFSFDRDGFGGYIKLSHLTRFGLEFYLACNPVIAKEVRKSLEAE